MPDRLTIPHCFDHGCPNVAQQRCALCQQQFCIQHLTRGALARYTVYCTTCALPTGQVVG